MHLNYHLPAPSLAANSFPALPAPGGKSGLNTGSLARFIFANTHCLKFHRKAHQIHDEDSPDPDTESSVLPSILEPQHQTPQSYSRPITSQHE